MSKKRLYRIRFLNQDNTLYEIYARHIEESDLFGFILVEDFVFGKTTSVVVDPSEERLKLEFNDVSRCFIPYNSILRIDEVSKEGVSKITDIKGSDNKVSQ